MAQCGEKICANNGITLPVSCRDARHVPKDKKLEWEIRYMSTLAATQPAPKIESADDFPVWQETHPSGTFSDWLKASVCDDWKRVTHHPFTDAWGDGALPGAIVLLIGLSHFWLRQFPVRQRSRTAFQGVSSLPL